MIYRPDTAEDGHSGHSSILAQNRLNESLSRLSTSYPLPSHSGALTTTDKPATIVPSTSPRPDDRRLRHTPEYYNEKNTAQRVDR